MDQTVTEVQKCKILGLIYTVCVDSKVKEINFKLLARSAFTTVTLEIKLSRFGELLLKPFHWRSVGKNSPHIGSAWKVCPLTVVVRVIPLYKAK